MKAALIDTDILSMFFRGHPQVVSHFDTYLKHHNKINLSIITCYEVISGLKHRDAKKQLSDFLKFTAHNEILPLTQESVETSAEVYANLRAIGQPLDDIDLLIAGTTMANGLVLATHNRKHFERIKGLTIEDWTESP